MKIIRTALTRDYLQVPNALARDDRLSHMARGCLVEILSRPDGWRITADQMWAEARESQGKGCAGRRAYRAAWAQLKANGYMTAERSLLDGGRYATQLTTRNVPVRPGTSGVDEAVDNPSTDVPPAGSPARPARIGVFAGQADDPHGGTSTTKNVVKKKTVKTPTDGRRPTSLGRGSRSGGCAATGGVRNIDVSAVGAVIGSLPADLRKQLPDLLPDEIVEAIRVELDRGITAAELTARADRRWFNHGYAGADPRVGGTGILRPVGVAIALVRRGKCAGARCDDGTDLDTGGYCRTCEREADDRRAAQERQQQPVQGAFLTSVPSAPWTPVPAQQAPARRAPGWLPLVTCERCDLAYRGAERRGLCGGCREEVAALSEPAESGELVSTA